MKIDERYDEVEKLLTDTPIPKEIQELLEIGFTGKHSTEFYIGLISGYGSALLMAQGCTDDTGNKRLLSYVVQFLAQKIKTQNSSTDDDHIDPLGISMKAIVDTDADRSFLNE